MSRVDEMRRGNRDAYREVLNEHGGGLQQVLQSWPEAADTKSLFVRLWQAALVAPEDVNERAFVAATAVTWMVQQAEQKDVVLTSPAEDLVSFAKGLARQTAGIASEDDDLFAADEPQDPRASDLGLRVKEATRSIMQAEAGPWSWAQDNWAELVAELR